MSFTFYLHTLLEICNHANGEDLTFDRVKGIVNELSKRSDAEDVHGVVPISPSAGDNSGCEQPKASTPKESVSPGNREEVVVVTEEKRKRSETAESTSSTLSRASSSGVGGKSGMERMLLNCELSFNPNTQVDHLDWIVRRLHGICNEICASFIQMHMDEPMGAAGGGRPGAAGNAHHRGSQDQEQPLFFLVAPKSPGLSSQPTEFFGMEFDEDDDDDDDVVIDEEEETEVWDKAKERAKSRLNQKFAAAWTPKVKFGVGSPQEQEVNIMTPSGGASKKGEKKTAAADSKKSGKSGPQLYTVATRKTIKSLMQEYKKRKTQHSRSVFVKKPTFKEQMYSKKLQHQSETSLTPAERQRRQQIREEQQTSITYDSDAQMNTWGDMILTMLQLLQLLPDSHFVALLPAVFPCLNQLVCHVDNSRVRQGVMEFMDRVAQYYGIV